MMPQLSKWFIMPWDPLEERCTQLIWVLCNIQLQNLALGQLSSQCCMVSHFKLCCIISAPVLLQIVRVIRTNKIVSDCTDSFRCQPVQCFSHWNGPDNLHYFYSVQYRAWHLHAKKGDTGIVTWSRKVHHNLVGMCELECETDAAFCMCWMNHTKL